MLRLRQRLTTKKKEGALTCDLYDTRMCYKQAVTYNCKWKEIIPPQKWTIRLVWCKGLIEENALACSCNKHAFYWGFMCYILHVVISNLHPSEWMICQTQSFFISNISAVTNNWGWHEPWEIFGAALPSSGNSLCQSPHRPEPPPPLTQQPVREPQPSVKRFERVIRWLVNLRRISHQQLCNFLQTDSKRN